MSVVHSTNGLESYCVLGPVQGMGTDEQDISPALQELPDLTARLRVGGTPGTWAEIQTRAPELTWEPAVGRVLGMEG